MKFALLLGLALGLGLGLVACSDPVYDEPNEIVFGIEQGLDPSGQPRVTAGYEFLGLAKKRGWSPRVFRDGDGDGTCYFERYADRLGKPLVENGLATWSGGQLGPDLLVFANKEDTVHAGAGWTSSDVLTFSAEGFAMPRLPGVRMRAPLVELAITAIAPFGEAGTTLKETDDVGVTWSAPPEPQASSRVMISLATESPSGAEVRCFAELGSGSAIIPARWVARLFDAVDPGLPVTGHLEIATHRQTTIVADGDWIVYVVATSRHRSLDFTGTR